MADLLTMSEGKSKTNSCIFYGCLTMVIVFIVLTVAAILGARYGIKKLVNTYTSPTMATLPAVNYTPDEYQTLTNRLESFRVESDTSTGEVTLELSAQDINILIQTQEGIKDFKDHFYVEIDKDTISSQLSVPLDRLEIGALKGRYLNGKAGLKVEVVNGRLDIRLDSLEVNGAPVGGSFMGQLKNENLAKDVQMSPEEEKIMKRVEKLSVKDGKVIIKVKPKAANTNAPPADIV